MMNLSLNPNKRIFIILLATITLCYIYLQVSCFLKIPEPKLFPDSNRYLQTTTVFSEGLEPKHGVTPPVVPLTYKLLGQNAEIISFAQLLFSMLSWTFLAFTVSSLLKRNWISILAYLSILTLSLSSVVSLWNGVILSESLGLSIFAFFIGSCMMFIEKQTLKRFAVLIISSLFFALSRTVHVYLLLIMGSVLAVFCFFKMSTDKRKYCIAVSVIFIVISLVSNMSANVGTQWTVYFFDVLTRRILPEPERRAYFERHGLPVNESLLKLEGKFAQDGDWAYYNDPELEEFREWLYSRGKSTYVRFLLTHPGFLITGPFEDFKRMMYGYRLKYYAPKGYESPLRGALFEYMDSPLIFLIYIFIAGILVGMNLIFAFSGKSRVSWVPVIMMLLVYPLVALVWHASSHELERHVVPFSVQARLGYILLAIFAVDEIFSNNAKLSKGDAEKKCMKNT